MGLTLRSYRVASCLDSQSNPPPCGCAEDFCETVAGIGPAQERVNRPIEDTACRVGTVVADHDLRRVILLADDIGVGLLDAAAPLRPRPRP